MKKKCISICVVIAARNEYPYLKVLLPLLASQNIEVVIIDNDSTDGSHDLYLAHKDNPIIRVENLSYKGVFSLSAQLDKKKEVYVKLKHDWIVHHDADEVLEHYRSGSTLRDALQEADEMGCNALNFEEFVFLPEVGEDYSGRDYYKELLRYYFFERYKNFLNRAWKREAGFNNSHLGGHSLKGDGVRIFQKNHVLRHYIALNEDRIKNKYSDRVFDKNEVKKGWHKDRLGISVDRFSLPDNNDFMFHLKSCEAKDFVRSNPAQDHYWQW